MVSVLNSTAGPDDVSLQVNYYDFSKAHTDFNNLQYVTVSNASYIDSPYGAWLSVSDTPTSDSFSDWFRKTSENYVLSTTLILEHQGVNHKRYKI